MNISELKGNTPVKLEYYLGGEVRKYDTKIVAIKNNIVLVEKILEADGSFAQFSQEMIANLFYMQQSKLYVWSDVKIEKVTLKQEVYYKVTLSDTNAEHINRRGAYRLFIGKETLASVTFAEGARAVKMVLKDVSESGFAVVSTEELDMNKRVEVRLEVAEGKFMRLCGHVVRIQLVDENRKEYVYGCALGQPSEELARYVMKNQMLNRKK